MIGSPLVITLDTSYMTQIPTYGISGLNEKAFLTLIISATLPPERHISFSTNNRNTDLISTKNRNTDLKDNIFVSSFLTH